MERDAMFAKSGKANLIHSFQSNPGLSALGVRADPIGRHALRISRNGRLLGICRESLGMLEWVPVGAVTAQFRALTSDDAVRQLNATCRA
jgi:hypothetical protein